MTWTADRRERCFAMWKDGSSATQIAQDLGGVTRNAVLGLVHRAGKAERHTASKPAKVAKVLKPAAPRIPRPVTVKLAGNATVFHEPAVARPPRAAAPPLEQVTADALLLRDLGPQMCRWGLNDPGRGRMDEALFCAAATGEGEVYCARHASRSIRPPEQQPKGSAAALARQYRWAVG